MENVLISYFLETISLSLQLIEQLLENFRTSMSGYKNI